MGSGVGHVEQEEGPMIKNLRRRFALRPTIPMAHTAREPRMMDLVIGRDNHKVFPELAQEAQYRRDDLVLCNIPFSPGQVTSKGGRKLNVATCC
jgi:hypothetical protein